MPNKKGLILAIALGGLCLPAAISYASAYDDPSQMALRLANDVQQGDSRYGVAMDTSQFTGTSAQVPQVNGGPLVSDSPTNPILTLDGGGTPSKLHGFGDLSANTSYTTPRGLVVEADGVSIQPLAGLVFDVYSNDSGPINDVSFVVGTWMNFLSHHSASPGATTNPAFNEIDFFPGVNIKFLQDFSLGVTWDIWISPPGNFPTEQNMEFKLAYDDTKILKDFALHPYVNVFYNFAGGSPVVTGKTGGSFYAEFGIAPGYTFKGITDYPITFTLPVYISVGQSGFWSANDTGGDIGVFSAGLQVSMPLSFIPKDFGFWKIHAGVTYYQLCNQNLVTASEILGNGNGTNRYLASIGVGFGF